MSGPKSIADVPLITYHDLRFATRQGVGVGVAIGRSGCTFMYIKSCLPSLPHSADAVFSPQGLVRGCINPMYKTKRGLSVGAKPMADAKVISDRYCPLSPITLAVPVFTDTW